jgi:group I intron endonuclease
MHTNKINEKKYIGITSKSPERRWGNNGSGYRKNQHFWRAIQKHGWDNFKHEILFTNVTRDFACFAEKCLVACHKTDDPLYGYNLTSGGDKGCTYSEESRRKISESRKGKYTGESSSMFGISPKERMDEVTYQQWLYKQKTNKPKGENHPMFGVSPKERMDEETYRQWREKRYDSPKNISVKCIETDKIYKSAREAERETGIAHSSITKSCSSEDHSVIAGGFHWCFGSDNLSMQDLGLEYKGKRYIRCVETGSIYKTAREVKRELGLDDSSINKCCKGYQFQTVGGLHWEYIYLLPDQYEELCEAI